MDFRKLLQIFEAAPAAPASTDVSAYTGNYSYSPQAAAPAAEVPAAAPVTATKPTYKGSTGAQNIAASSGVKNVNKIRPGQELTLPSGEKYTVQKGDTMDRIARRNPAQAANPNQAAVDASNQVQADQMAKIKAAGDQPAFGGDNKPATVVKEPDPNRFGGQGYDPTGGNRAGYSSELVQPSVDTRDGTGDNDRVAAAGQVDTGNRPPEKGEVGTGTGGTLMSRGGPAKTGAQAQADMDTLYGGKTERTADDGRTYTRQKNPLGGPDSENRSYKSFGDFFNKVRGRGDVNGAMPPAAPNGAQVQAVPPQPQVDVRPLPAVKPPTVAMEGALAEMLRLSGLTSLSETAVSTDQATAARIALKHKREGTKPKKGTASAEMMSMSIAELKKFAKTKTKNLPKQVSESVSLSEGGNTLDHITNRFKHEVMNFTDSGFMDDDLYHALYDYYRDNGDIPYSAIKTDPYAWVSGRFAQDIGAQGGSNDHELSELARLAGLTEAGENPYAKAKGTMKFAGTDTSGDKGIATKATSTDTSGDKGIFSTSKPKQNEGMGDDLAYGAGQVTGTVKRGAGEMVDAFKRGMSDAETPTPSDTVIGRRATPPSMGKPPSRDIATKPQMSRPPRDIAKAPSMGTVMPNKRDITPTPNPRSMGAGIGGDGDIEPPMMDTPKDYPDALKECGDMSPFSNTGHSDEQESSMNVSTNMSSDGTKNVTISADGEQAEQLLQMLKIAGLENSPAADRARIVIATPAPEEMMGESQSMVREGSGKRLVKKLGDAISGAKIYKDMEWNEFVVKFYKNGRALPEESWYHTDDMQDALDTAESELASETAMRDAMHEEYANEPDEEYETIQAITTQGNDLNRQKKQFKRSYRNGDNPMSMHEQLNLDEALEEMLDSIKLTSEGSIVGGVWTADAPKKGRPNVPAPSALDEPVGGFPSKGKPARPAPAPKSDIELDFDRRAKADKGGPLEAERGGVKGATNPPPDSEFPPGDSRNYNTSTKKGMYK